MMQQHAVILIGHGSLRSASGASMIRIAARLRERGVAPVVEATFLNYSRPTLAETVAKIAATPLGDQGVTRIIVQPYFLIAGYYVQQDLRALVSEVSAQFPMLTFQLAPVLGDHPALTDLAQRRVQAARGTMDQELSFQGVCDDRSRLRLPAKNKGISHDARNDSPALLLMAHGTPLPEANAPLYALADTLAQRLGLVNACVAYLDCNAPTIPDGIDQLVAAGARQIIAFPYFLHMGRHVAEDLPHLITAAQAKHAATTIHLAHHLDYDLALVDAVQGLLPLATPLAIPAPAVTVS